MSRHYTPSANPQFNSPASSSVIRGEFSAIDAAMSATDAEIDTKVGVADTRVLLNKTINLSSNTLSGTVSEFNAALSNGDFATLSGTEVLTNKTMSGSFTGNVTGDLVGNVTGNVTGNLVGNVTGQVNGSVNGSSGSCTGNSATATMATDSDTLDGQHGTFYTNPAIATQAEVVTGTDNVKMMTALSAVMPSTKTETGYTKLAGGLIIQWGKLTSSAATNFSIAFPTACVFHLASFDSNTVGSIGANQFYTTVTTTQITAPNYTGVLKYIAVGY